jgi:hypothetical protein
MMIAGSVSKVGHAMQQTMFARSMATFGEGTAARFGARDSGRNRADASAAPPPSRRSVLAAHWRITSDGSLEAQWLLTNPA